MQHCGAMLDLRRELISRKVAEAFGGSPAAVAASWPIDPVPHRSTVLRWLTAGTFPRSARQFLALAGALDVDPFSLWSFRASTFDLLCARIIGVARQRRWSRLHPALSFVDRFLGPTAQWPPVDIAEDYFERPWHIADFEHPARINRNYYGRILIESPRAHDFSDPQVWYFAHRDTGVRNASWHPYGFVQRMGVELSLFNFSGLTDRAEMVAAPRRFCVETWFGEGAAQFRVASLHDYRLEIAVAANPGVPSVRFALPR